MDRRIKRSWVRVRVLIDYRFALTLSALTTIIWLLIR